MKIFNRAERYTLFALYGKIMPVVVDTSNKKHKSQVNSDENLANLITSRTADGNIQVALRILQLDDKPAEDNDATYTKLFEHHPPAPANRIIEDVAIPNDLCLQLTGKMSFRQYVVFRQVLLADPVVSVHNTLLTCSAVQTSNQLY